MKRFLLIGVLLYSISAFAKVSYYYYKGTQIPLILRDDSVQVYMERKNSHDNIASEFTSQVIEISRISSYLDDYTSAEYLIYVDAGQSVKISNKFYVQLYDVADTIELKRLAKLMRARIVGSVPYMPDWYKLVADHSMINNSLELSNYFFETGLFKDVDPGFVFDFSPSCVSDSHFSRQWGMPKINACNAWSYTKGRTDVRIAILDKEIYQNHTEFISTQFMHSHNCMNNPSPSLSYSEHGTMVCGIIASDHNHARIAGIAPNCPIIPIAHNLSATDDVSEELASGICWAIDSGASVINCSWGDHNGALYAYLHSTLLESALNTALTTGRSGRGCVVVFAAGNQNSTQVDYPAYVFPDIMTIGALDSLNSKAWFSSYGNALDVVAPGVAIYSSTDTGGYKDDSGTSFSAPYVSGIAGLILSVNPYLTQKEVADIIESTAQKVGGYTYTSYINRPNGTWNDSVGYGLVDAYAAVKEAKSRYIQGPDYVCDTAKYYLIHPSQPGDTVLWSVNNGNYAYPHYSIIGANNQDTVYVRCERATPAIPVNPKSQDRQMLMGVQSISVTISNGTSETYTKEFREPTGAKPTVSVSNSVIFWRSGTSRTFTITNCVTAPDSVLTWEVKKTIVYTNGNPNVTTYSYYTGRTLTYIATAPLHAQTMLQFTVTNTLSECEPKSEVLSFAVIRSPFLSAYDGGNILDVTISEDESGETSQQTTEDRAPQTLELWHNIYGSMGTQQVRSDHEQMDITGLPHGVYVLLLKENGEVIAQTKVNIN